jgi:hypothetical protein
MIDRVVDPGFCVTLRVSTASKEPPGRVGNKSEVQNPGLAPELVCDPLRGVGTRPVQGPRAMAADTHDKSYRSHIDDPLDLTDTDNRANRMRDAVDGWLSDLTGAIGEACASDRFRW